MQPSSWQLSNPVDDEESQAPAPDAVDDLFVTVPTSGLRVTTGNERAGVIPAVPGRLAEISAIASSVCVTSNQPKGASVTRFISEIGRSLPDDLRQTMPPVRRNPKGS